MVPSKARSKPRKKRAPSSSRSAVSDVTFRDVARATGRPVALVRPILREDPKFLTDKATKDLVFQTARALGYDFQKLRLGKRLDLRQNAIAEILRKIEEKPSWDRVAIIAYLKNAADLSRRVQRRMFGADA